MPHYHTNNDLNKVRSINGDLDWLVINYFYGSVDNDED